MAASRMKAQPEQRYQEVLSQQAVSLLQSRGYSAGFIAGLQMMLREANAVNNDPTNRYYDQFSVTEQEKEGPTSRIPAELKHHCTETTYRGRRITMPDIGSYAPNTTYYPETYRAFASSEGQRFMRRFYTSGWLRRDPSSDEWAIRPPSGTVPRRTR